MRRFRRPEAAPPCNWCQEDQLASMASAQFGQLKQRHPDFDRPRLTMRWCAGWASGSPTSRRRTCRTRDWEFVVFDDDSQVNAFAMPGGKVAVYTGIFQGGVKPTPELAVVIGHEIAHVAARARGRAGLRSKLLAAGGGRWPLAGRSLSASDMDRRGANSSCLDVLAYGPGPPVGVLLP